MINEREVARRFSKMETLLRANRMRLWSTEKIEKFLGVPLPGLIDEDFYKKLAKVRRAVKKRPSPVLLMDKLEAE